MPKKQKNRKQKKIYTYPKSNSSEDNSSNSSKSEKDISIEKGNDQKNELIIETKENFKLLGENKYIKKNWKQYLKENDVEELEKNFNIKTLKSKEEKKEILKYSEYSIIDNSKIITDNEITKNSIMNQNENKDRYKENNFINNENDNNILNKLSQTNLVTYFNSDESISSSDEENSLKSSNEEKEEKETEIISKNTNLDVEEKKTKVLKETKKSSGNDNNNPFLNYLFVSDNTNEINEDKIEKLNEENIVFNGKTFTINKKNTKYIKKNNIKRIVYKCIYQRHDEKIRQELHTKAFCDATIEYIYPGQNTKSGYFLSKDHSNECQNKYLTYSRTEAKIEFKKEKFEDLCLNVMNSSNIFDRRLFKEEFKKIYNNPNYKFNFPLNNNYLSNLITKWKNTSNRFNKTSILFNKYDYENRLIFREYRSLYIQTENKNNPINYEYVIWANEENISRMGKAENLYIDATFHHPPEFKELLIFMYKDIITELKIPGIYALLNNKSEKIYELVFKDVLKILTWNSLRELNVKTVVTDSEKALINNVNRFFPNAQRVACYYHYKSDILRNIKSYGLYKNNMKIESNKLLRILSNIPFIYKGNIDIVNKILEHIKVKFVQYNNFIDNYFIPNKIQYFIDNSLNYSIIPDDCRTNNFLENYNGYLKKSLGKQRIINWVNFLNFIKNESSRSYEKLFNNKEYKIKYIKKKIENKDVESHNDNNIKIQKNSSLNKLSSIIKEETNIIPEKNYLKKNISKDLLFKTIFNKEKQIGFINIGNTCYINSIIQILIHNKEFTIEFINYIDKIRNNQLSISHKLLNIYEMILKKWEFAKYANAKFANLAVFGNFHKQKNYN